MPLSWGTKHLRRTNVLWEGPPADETRLFLPGQGSRMVPVQLWGRWTQNSRNQWPWSLLAPWISGQWSPAHWGLIGTVCVWWDGVDEEVRERPRLWLLVAFGLLMFGPGYGTTKTSFIWCPECSFPAPHSITKSLCFYCTNAAWGRRGIFMDQSSF